MATARQKEYQKYLNSAEWKSLSAGVRKRANYMCEICLNDVEAVHHLRYPDLLADDKAENTIAICDHCHKAIHGIQRKETLRSKLARMMVELATDTNGDEAARLNRIIRYTNRVAQLLALYHKG